jgi:hypothetical protein
MPFDWGKTKLPKELEEMDPNDVVAAVKKAKDLDPEAIATKAAEKAGAAFETFRTEFTETMTAKLDEIASRMPKPVASNGGGDNQLADFLTDPDRAFAQRSAPIAALALENAKYAAKNAAREKLQRQQRANPGKNFDGFFFEKFEAEIDELAKTVSAVQLAQPGTWEHLYFNIKGRHTDEVVAQVRDGKADFLVESGATGATTRQQDDPNNIKLTAQEESLAKKMGVTPEVYLAQKKSQLSGGLGVNLNV